MFEEEYYHHYCLFAMSGADQRQWAVTVSFLHIHLPDQARIQE